MMRSLKHGMLVALLLPLIFGLNTAVSASGMGVVDSSAPTLVGEPDEISIAGKPGNGNEETPGEWYAGDAPASPIANSPVLLFVPGLNNVAQIFWEDNDMYQTALDAGYQTAFIQLNDAGGESANMWDNGELLAEKVKEISEHFDNRKITIIAYSKGGVDTQTALTYYGASDYVDNVITLSSPHHGSQLADLAYSSWAGWLADLIGAKGDGTYSMQMGNMEAFREQIDREPLAYATNYYTLGGTDWGSLFSSNWFGGTYLSQYGPNDGVVTTASSALPGGQELAIGDWNHTSIRTGETFSVFENYLMSSQEVRRTSFPGESVKDDIAPSMTQWVHGGPLVKGERTSTSISVEGEVETLQLQVLTSEPVKNFQLVDGDGKEVSHKLNSHHHVEGIFTGAHSYLMTIEKPQAGEWELIMDADEDNAYLLVAEYSKASEVVTGGSAELKGNQQFSYQLNIDSSEVQENSIRATYRITQSSDPKNNKTYRINGQATLSQQFSVEQTGEVYNITIDIEGLTKSGEPFKRTVIDSVYVDK